MIPQISKRYRDLPVGTRIEICPDAELYIMKMAKLLSDSNDKGAILVIDYGTENEIPENSLRGIYQHKFVSPFWNPGEVDLSIDVDFQALKQLTEGIVDIYGPLKQGDWLHNIGIGYRIDQVLKRMNKTQKYKIRYMVHIEDLLMASKWVAFTNLWHYYQKGPATHLDFKRYRTTRNLKHDIYLFECNS